MVEDTRDDEGQFSDKATDEQYVAAIEELKQASTSGVLKYLKRQHGIEVTQPTAYRHLKELARDEGRISEKKGGKTTWMTKEMFDASTSDTEFIHAIEDEGGIAKTEEVAEALDYDINSTERKLKELNEKGKIKLEGMGGKFTWELVD